MFSSVIETIQTFKSPIVVRPTTLVHLQRSQALVFVSLPAFREEALSIMGTSFLEPEYVQDFWLDLAQLAQDAPLTVDWLKEQRCITKVGCRVSVHHRAVMRRVLWAFQNSTVYADQNYLTVAADPLDVFTAIQRAIEHPSLQTSHLSCVYQEELPWVYIPITQWTNRTLSVLNHPVD